MIKEMKILFTILLAFFFSFAALSAQAAQQDCSTDESKCWSDSTDSAGIPDTPVKGILVKGETTKDITSFYVEITKPDSFTKKQYFYFIPADQKPATPCSRVKGDLVKIGFKEVKKGTYTLNKLAGDQGPSMQTMLYIKEKDVLKSSSEKSDVTLVIKELGDKAKGRVKIKFKGGTEVAGTFDAHVCK